MQRTGSNMLVSALNSHPEICCHGELFRRIRRERSLLKGALKVLKKIDPAFSDDEQRFTRPAEYIDAVYALSGDSLTKGFKLMLLQHPEYCDTLIDDAAVRKIVLHRDNLLACYSSDRIAKVTGQGAAGRFAKVVTAKVPFKADQFERYIAKRRSAYDQVYRRLDAAGQTYLDVEYLDLVNGKGLSRVRDFLGVSPDHDLEVVTQKRNPSSLLDRFENPDVVDSYLRDHGLEHWRVEDVRVPTAA